MLYFSYLISLFFSIQGPVGPQGEVGPQGPPGVCNCSVSDITFMNVNVTNDFTLGGNFSCTPGSFIDPSCLLVGNCPSFAACDLVAKSLLLQDGDNPVTFLQVGKPGVFTTNVLMGDSGVTIPDYRLNSIKGYAELTTWDARTLLNLRASLGNVIISAAGSIASLISISSAGSINHNAVSDMTANVGGAYNVFAASSMRLYSSSDWQGRGNTVNLTSNAISLRKFSPFGTGIIWMETLEADSLTLGCTVPLTPGISPSIRVAEDLRLANTRSFVSESADGFLRMGPYEDLVGGRLKSSGCGRLSFENPIANDVNGSALMIDDAEGLDLKSTHVFTSTEAAITFDNDLVVNSGITTGTLTATTINADTINGAMGSCCTSDRRMKKNVQKLNQTAAMERINGLHPVTFEYVKTYLEQDKWVKKGTHTGFIAQDLKKSYPNAVITRAKKIGGELVDDFHMVRKDELIAEMVAAIQHLHERVMNLEAKLVK